MLLVDERGAPLSIIVIGANRHDVTQLATTLDAIVVERPEVRPYHPQNLCADAGFSGRPAHGLSMESIAGGAFRECQLDPQTLSRMGKDWGVRAPLAGGSGRV